MKRLMLTGILAMLVCSWAICQEKEVSKPPAIKTEIDQDTTEYEVIITDIHFDQWYLTNFNETKDRTNEFYRSKDQIGASNWNYYYQSHLYTLIITDYLNFQPNIDYGIDVNRKLYWYFKFLEETEGIRLLR